MDPVEKNPITYCELTTEDSYEEVDCTSKAAHAAFYLLEQAYHFCKYMAKSFINVARKESYSIYTTLDSHNEKCDEIQQAFRSIARDADKKISIGKSGTHLFRPRIQSTTKIDMRQLSQVIDLDPENNIVHVEGALSIFDLADELLEFGLLPKVVPELDGITVGGAISGLAIESSSFRYGLFHESVVEVEVLTGTGDIVTCRRDNEYADLFYGLPNSYGSLGYILSAKIECVPAKPYVHVTYRSCNHLSDYFNEIEKLSRDDCCDFLDGAIFGTNHQVLVLGVMCDDSQGLEVSNYPGVGVYYQRMQELDSEMMTTKTYLHRWNYDSFWGTDELPILQNPYVRKLLGRKLLGHKNLMALKNVSREFYSNVIVPFRAPVSKEEKLIQDVGVPIEKCAEFVDWFADEIGIFPIFVCPTSTPEEREDDHYPLWNFNENRLSCDIGFFGKRETEFDPEDGFYNKIVEEKLEEIGGKKSLYSRSYFDREKFEELYYGENGEYRQLKDKYDPESRFLDLFEKCVQNR